MMAEQRRRWATLYCEATCTRLEKDAEREARSVNSPSSTQKSRLLKKSHPELRQKHLGEWVAVHESLPSFRLTQLSSERLNGR